MLKKLPSEFNNIIKPLEAELGGKVTMDHQGHFYLEIPKRGKVEMSLIAEGLRTQKVRDTIAGLYGAFRSFNEELQPFYRPLVSEKRQSVKIVLLLEEDRPPERAKSFKYRRSQLQKVLNEHLKFLSVHCYVHNSSDLPRHFQWSVK